MDHRRDRNTDGAARAPRGAAELLAVMEQSDLDLASGLTVPLADVAGTSSYRARS